VYFRTTPETAWRYVFLCGLIPAAIAFMVRLFIKEPERWTRIAKTAKHATIGDLFAPAYLRATLTGLSLAIVALVTWWTCNAFIPTIASGLAAREASLLGAADTTTLIEQWKALATNTFNLGGLIGTLLTIPASKLLGRRHMFAIYFFGSAVSVLAAFGLPLEPHTRLYMYFPIGLTVFGVFGSFTYYLPELYPTRLRGTGPGFTYNTGRVVAAVGPFLVGSIASRGVNALDTAMYLLFFVGFVPLAGLLVIPFMIETRDRALID
jgi:MFS family permease